jgi:hypothetical protein
MLKNYPKKKSIELVRVLMTEPKELILQISKILFLFQELETVEDLEISRLAVKSILFIIQRFGETGHFDNQQILLNKLESNMKYFYFMYKSIQFYQNVSNFYFGKTKLSSPEGDWAKNFYKTSLPSNILEDYIDDCFGQIASWHIFLSTYNNNRGFATTSERSSDHPKGFALRMTSERSSDHGKAVTSGQRLGPCPRLCFGRSPKQSPDHVFEWIINCLSLINSHPDFNGNILALIERLLIELMQFHSISNNSFSQNREPSIIAQTIITLFDLQFVPPHPFIASLPSIIGLFFLKRYAQR